MLKTAENKISYRGLLWAAMMTALFLMGSFLTVRELFTIESRMLLEMGVVTAAGLLSCFTGRFSGKWKPARWIRWILITVFILVWPGFFRITDGLTEFLNVLIVRWNRSQHYELALFTARSAEGSLWYFVLTLCLICGQIVYVLVTRRSKVFGGSYCLVFFLLQLMAGAFTPFGSSCLIAGLLGLCMVDRGEGITRLKLYGLVFISLVLSVFAFIAPGTELTAVSSFRKSTGEQIHSLRYGKEVLPQGDLRKAALFTPDQREMLVVRTEQEKNLYLRGFVGEDYVNGSWQELPETAYGGENAGLMKWLYMHNFDPLTQTASYYSLLNEEDQPEKNRIWISTAAASRYYIYAPSSSTEASVSHFGKRRDHRLKSRDLTGSGFYEIQEMSGGKPAEIMIADEFVRDPKTQEQKSYCEAEAVYRNFVYEQDTVIDRQTYEIVNEMFFADYEPENESIYSVVTQIRKVLKAKAFYTEEALELPDRGDPFIFFLTQSHRGNASYYATAAVAAFRARGIPARYVEGYYLSEDQISRSKDGTVTLTGKDAHAWAEVYFDGIGWQPVDVTPGYYFDAVALQQMVGMPDTVHKTAALQNDPLTAEQVTDMEENGSENIQEQIITGSRRLAMILLGTAAVFLLIATGFFLGAELMRFVLLLGERKREEKEAAADYVVRMKKRIYHRLSLWEIQAVFSLQSEMTDQEICKKIDTIRAGEYSRVCELMEKTVYGGIDLTTYERRTLKSFVDKISSPTETCGWKLRLKLRYADLMQ